MIRVSSQAEEGMKSFLSLRCSRNTEKFPDADIRVPSKCTLVQHQLLEHLWESENQQFFFSHVSEKPQFFFLGLIFIIQEVQNEDSLSRQFCSPVLDRDEMIKSSAYDREGRSLI